jgi:uncharacterized membrane protein YphA (DoxX/SURF4 family)
MTFLRVVSSIALGAVMCLAGGSKLRMGRAWREQARGMGAPIWTAPFVPWVEILLGALLVVQVWTSLFAFLAVVLLTAFTLLIMMNLSQDKHPVCACFGAWSAGPLSTKHVMRNGVLIAIGAIAFVTGLA